MLVERIRRRVLEEAAAVHDLGVDTGQNWETGYSIEFSLPAQTAELEFPPSPSANGFRYLGWVFVLKVRGKRRKFL